MKSQAEWGIVFLSLYYIKTTKKSGPEVQDVNTL